MRNRSREPRASVVIDLLRRHQASLATAESLTGGQLAVLMTEVPGSSEVYRGGVVAYATDLKVGVLEVPEAVVGNHGVVSAECAHAMARGVRRLSGATYAVSTTGVAGPEPQEGKPVGTVFVAVAGPDDHDAVLALELVGDRRAIQERTCLEALDCMARTLQGKLQGEEPRLR